MTVFESSLGTCQIVCQIVHLLVSQSLEYPGYVLAHIHIISWFQKGPYPSFEKLRYASRGTEILWRINILSRFLIAVYHVCSGIFNLRCRKI